MEDYQVVKKSALGMLNGLKVAKPKKKAAPKGGEPAGKKPKPE
jgi:hypothetical protein